MSVRTRLHSGAISAVALESADESSSGGRLGRYVLVTAGVLILVYLVARVFGSSDDAIDEIQERAMDAVPDEPTQSVSEAQHRASDLVTIPIGEPDVDDVEPDVDSPTGAGERSGDVIDEAEPKAEDTAADLDDEIAERAESDVQAEPAEPGEMTVDEDVVEDIVDDVDADSEPESDGKRTDDESEQTDDDERDDAEDEDAGL